MRWIAFSALSLWLFAAPLGAQQAAPLAVLPEAAERAKSVPAAVELTPDVFAIAGQRARQVASQGAGEGSPPAPQRSPRFLTLDVERDSRAGVVYAWSIAGAGSEQGRALLLVTRILTGDLATGLNRQLLGESRLADGTRAWLHGDQGGDVFLIQVAGVRTDRIEQIEAIVEAQLERLASSGPDSWELGRARAGLELELSGGADPLGPSSLIEAFRSVTPEDVRKAVSAYLRPWRKTAVEIRPRGSPEPWVPKPGDVSPPPFRLHTLKKGETLKTVARRHGLDERTLAKANGLDAKASVYVGQTLKIPRSVPAVARKGSQRSKKPEKAAASSTSAPSKTRAGSRGSAQSKTRRGTGSAASKASKARAASKPSKPPAAERASAAPSAAAAPRKNAGAASRTPSDGSPPRAAPRRPAGERKGSRPTEPKKTRSSRKKT